MSTSATTTLAPRRVTVDLCSALPGMAGVGVALGAAPHLINGVVALGIGVVAPMALGGSTAAWGVAAFAAALGMHLEPGFAAIWGLPAMWMALDAGRRSLSGYVSPYLSQSRRERIDALSRLDRLAPVVATAWAIGATGSVVASLAGWTMFGIGEPIVRLTGVHYLYAGVGSLTIAHRLWVSHHRRDPVRRPRRSLTGLATAGVVATIVAPPVVALGFITESALPQVGGALLMTVGVWASAVLLVGAARTEAGSRRTLTLIAGLAPWIPMVLAVAWAAANHWADVPALSVPDMARTHGLVNGIGFVILGLWVTRQIDPDTAP